jgi:hypothetical protein
MSCNKLSNADQDVPVVAKAMKKARDIVQYFNKSTQATKKLKDQQQESSLPKYSGQPKNILQDVKTRWWLTYHMLKRLQFLREAISHYVVDDPHDTDLENLTLQEWKLCHQVEITHQQWHSGNASLRVRSMSLVPSSQWQFTPFVNRSCKLSHLMEVIQL